MDEKNEKNKKIFNDLDEETDVISKIFKAAQDLLKTMEAQKKDCENCELCKDYKKTMSVLFQQLNKVITMQEQEIVTLENELVLAINALEALKPTTNSTNVFKLPSSPKTNKKPILN
jgi:acetolactate synthase regulatory subunit